MFLDPPEGPSRPALPSRATRRISLRSRASGRAVLALRLPAHDRPVRVVCESLTEARVALCLAARRDVWDLIDPPAAVHYTNASGRMCTHHLDFLFFRPDGSRIAVAVKPWAKVQAAFREELCQVAAAMPPTLASRLILITDRDLAPDEVWTAARLQEALRCPDPAADGQVLDWFAMQSEPQPLHRLATATGLGPRAWPPATRLLFAGRLRRADRGRIGAATLLWSQAPA